MTTFNIVLYLLLLAGATAAVLARRSWMPVLAWPVVFLYPHAWFRQNLIPFSPLGLHDAWLLLCLPLLLVDVGRVRRGLEPGLMRRVAVLLAVALAAHLWGASVLLVRHPTSSWRLPLELLASDLRSLVPLLAAAAYVRTARDIRVAAASFALSAAAAFGLVVADRYLPEIFAMFNHTSYWSDPNSHARRAVGGFTGPWEVGAVAALTSAWVLAMVTDRRRLGLLPGLALLGLAFLGTAFSQSRAGLLAGAAAIGGMALLSPWRSRWRVAVLLGVVAVVVLSLRLGASGWESYGVADLIERRFETAYDAGHLTGSAEVRVGIWARQWDWLRSGQISGAELAFGVGGIEGAVREFQASTHSGFLGPLVYYGLPVGLAMLLAFGGVAAAALREAWALRRPGALMMVVAMAVSMVSGEFLVSVLTSGVLGFLAVTLERTVPVTAPAVRPRPVATGPAASAPGLPASPTVP